jgi:glutaryl-CoA dehydrogenase
MYRANWKDLFGSVARYRRANPENASMIDTVERFCDQELRARITTDYGSATPDKMRALMSQFGELGIFGLTVPRIHGGIGLDSTTYGLMAKSIESVDSGYRSAFSVQSSLVMGPISEFGTEYQRKKYLPELYSGRMIGCFGLTEPNAGSDPGGMTSTAVRDGDEWIVTASKTWITNAPIADLCLIWAKDVDDGGRLKGFLVERDTPGLETPVIPGKESLKASITGSIIAEEIRVPVANVLDVSGYKGPFSCLNSARMGIAYGALGAAERSIDVALRYTEDRHQFGSPLASKQAVQIRLANAVREYNMGLAGCMAATAATAAGGPVDPTAISVLKRNSVQKSLDIARDMRDMLGGNGIVGDYEIIRHMVNLETVNTYEGTATIHDLIVGRAVTGHSAF